MKLETLRQALFTAMTQPDETNRDDYRKAYDELTELYHTCNTCGDGANIYNPTVMIIEDRVFLNMAEYVFYDTLGCTIREYCKKYYYDHHEIETYNIFSNFKYNINEKTFGIENLQNSVIRDIIDNILNLWIDNEDEGEQHTAIGKFVSPETRLCQILYQAYCENIGKTEPDYKYVAGKLGLSDWLSEELGKAVNEITI